MDINFFQKGLKGSPTIKTGERLKGVSYIKNRGINLIKGSPTIRNIKKQGKKGSPC